LSTLFLVEHENIDLEKHPWYKQIIYYLQFQKCSDNFEYHECRRLRLEASKYMILGTSLFRKSVNGLLLRCVENTSTQNILKQIHGSADSCIHIGGHFTAKATTHKILRTIYYCPSIFKDSYKTAQACDECQKFAHK
jgi:hypothetical protein